MEWIVDRIEENIAVLECGDKIFELEKALLPPNVKEGDVLNISIDESKTKSRLEIAVDKMNRLFSKD